MCSLKCSHSSIPLNAITSSSLWLLTGDSSSITHLLLVGLSFPNEDRTETSSDAAVTVRVHQPPRADVGAIAPDGKMCNDPRRSLALQPRWMMDRADAKEVDVGLPFRLTNGLWRRRPTAGNPDAPSFAVGPRPMMCHKGRQRRDVDNSDGLSCCNQGGAHMLLVARRRGSSPSRSAKAEPIKLCRQRGPSGVESRRADHKR